MFIKYIYKYILNGLNYLIIIIIIIIKACNFRNRNRYKCLINFARLFEMYFIYYYMKIKTFC